MDQVDSGYSYYLIFYFQYGDFLVSSTGVIFAGLPFSGVIFYLWVGMFGVFIESNIADTSNSATHKVLDKSKQQK